MRVEIRLSDDIESPAKAPKRLCRRVIAYLFNHKFDVLVVKKHVYQLNTILDVVANKHVTLILYLYARGLKLYQGLIEHFRIQNFLCELVK